MQNNRIGCEIKGMIQCPNGYIFVGSCLSSCEFMISWIISGLIGDSLMNRRFGSTHFSKYNYLEKKRAIGLNKKSSDVN